MTVVKEPPPLNREDALRRDEARRLMCALVRQTVGRLAPGERLGAPRREGDRIILPVVKAEDGDLDAPSLHALVAAWLDEPAL